MQSTKPQTEMLKLLAIKTTTKNREKKKTHFGSTPLSWNYYIFFLLQNNKWHFVKATTKKKNNK
jgi:hypothetical protein